MIDINHENLLLIREVPRRLPHRPTGRPVHISAVYRWMQPGIRGVRLEAIKIGGLTYTSIEALQRFFNRLSPAPGELPTPVQPSARPRQRRVGKVDQEVASILGTA